MVYEGKEKYIFVSYAHKDADRVLPIIDALSNDGYRVWFDSGIEAGTEWPEYIEDHLINSHVVLVFMSPSAIESRNCRNEINFALELKKEILVVYLEDTTLLKGMHLQLNSTQSLFRKHHKSDETFIRELLRARILSECHANRTDPAPAPAAVSVSFPSAGHTPAKKSRTPLFLMLGAILIALIVLICVIAFGGNDSTNEPTEPPATIETTEPPAPLEMSDNLFDYTMEIEGVIYQLPCRYEDLTSQGWTISSSSCTDATLIKGGGHEYFLMSNNGKKIGVTSYNTSGNSKAIKDCLVGGLEVEAYNNASCKIAKDITVKSTVDEILAAFGTPNNQNTQTDYTVLTYQDANNEYGCVKFFIYTDPDMMKFSSITMENAIVTNEKTETNTDRPAYLDTYKAPSQLGTDPTVPVANIDGDLYMLPAPVSAFTANGWKIVQQPNFVSSGNTDSIRIERNGKEMFLNITNFADYQTTAENCAVHSVNLYAEDGVPMELPNGITFDLKGSQVQTLVSEAFDYDEFSTSNIWSYSEYGELDLYITVKINAETDLVHGLGVSCLTWPYQ